MTPRFRPPHRDRRRLEVLRRLASTLPRIPTVSGITDAMAQELTLAVDRADECTISSWEPALDRLVIMSAYDRRGGIDESWRNVAYDLCDWPASRRLLEMGTDHRQYRSTDPGWSRNAQNELQDWGWRSWIALPLVVENRSVGLIEVVDYGSDRPWNAGDVGFCATVASQAAMAVRNAQLNERLERQLDRDPLTGLLNHRAFHQRLSGDLERISRTREPLAVMIIDLDELRRINDRSGHLAGDTTLLRVADVLRDITRDGDIAGRLGGDEFAVVLPGVDGDATLVASRLISLLQCHAGVAASLGATLCIPGEHDPASVIKRAERALREAKRAGRRSFRLSA